MAVAMSMRTAKRSGGWVLVSLLTAALAPAAERTVDRLQSEARGFYLLWSQEKPDAEQILGLPFMTGGQIVLQWGEVEPARGRYDFSAIDAALARFAKLDKWTTLQVNGNLKPAWLFDAVPHVKEKLSEQVRDTAGTLMFWHPVFQDAYLAMLGALAQHLQASPHRARLLGLRLNFNAIGTEHFAVPPELREPGGWIWPAGAKREGGAALSPAVQEAYIDRVVAAYDRLFADWATVFVRNNISDELRAKYADKFARGRLAFFHTSSEAEPRSAGLERQYGAFYDFCRSGQTVGYAEPWASAWGEHGGMIDVRWCSPAQWNYWTMLLNLHCGVSFIGEYYVNLHYAVSGQHGRDTAANPRTDGPREFMAAYEWGGRYVGRHNRPAESPGAWVAFRENPRAKADNPKVLAKGRTLQRFTGDYTWLAARVGGSDGSIGVGPVGPPEQRYGAFARKYPPGRSARVRLDPEFVHSLNGDTVVRVIALGEAAATLKVGAAEFQIDASPQRWRVSEFHLPAARLQAASGEAQVEVRAGERDLILHLVEVQRGDGRLSP